MKRVIRPSNYTSERIAGGVCAGISEYFNIDLFLLRTLWFISFFAYGFGLFLYIILWVILPSDK